MKVNFNPDVNSILPRTAVKNAASGADNKVNFGKAVAKYLNKVNEQQTEANASISDLISRKTEDINSVVASVAKADMSFKLLVGVRNKLVEAYKETMKMQI